MPNPPRKVVGIWLFVCCALLFAMIVVGGITRLTHSGLSIVEWQPLVGTIPPLTQSQWLEVYEKYKLTPEYRHVNHGMDLEAFKGIFWWEYAHRLLGRLIGLVFLIPLLYLIARRRVQRAQAVRLAGIFALGALQGALGWYMVKSGLVDNPRVSQYRLTAHLGLAFLIFAAMFWTALDSFPAKGHSSTSAKARMANYGFGLVAAVFVMVLSGGLLAGIRAGLAYNTFPLMDGHWVPPEILLIEPWYLNFFNNMATVQFDHRLIALLLVVGTAGAWIACLRMGAPPRARVAALVMMIVLGIQVSLGIATLLLRVPVPLAAAHQGGAVLLFATALWLAKELHRSFGPR